MTDDLIAERPNGGAPVTPAMQDYLKAVYRLGANGPVATQQLADEFSRLVQLYPTQWHVVQEFFPGVRA